MSFPLIKISLKFASITRIHVLATPLGYHPISCSLLYIGKKHYSAANRSRFIVKMCNHVTISDEINNLNLHCSTYYAHWCGEKKSVTINYKHGKLNIQLTPITQTQLTRTVFRFPSEFEVPGFYCISCKKSYIQDCHNFREKTAARGKMSCLRQTPRRSGALISMSI